MTVVLAGGGTGGHVYPALAVAEALRRSEPAGEEQLGLVYLGTEHGVEADLAPRAGLTFHSVRAAGVRGRNPLSMAKGALALMVGTAQAWRSLGKEHADVVFATGGYASVPAGVAARLRRKPLVVYLPDVQPGWAVQFLSRLATRLATSSEASLEFLPEQKTEVTGYPVRDDFWGISKAEARARLHLADDLPVLLVSGASQGARSINKAIAANAEALTDLCQIVHVSGKRDELWLLCARGNLPVEKLNRWQVRGYMHDLPLAMIAADLAVMRSGASVLGELPAAGLPAILVPYPYAGAHQRHNAEYLQSKGAAIVLEDDRMNVLVPTIRELLGNRVRLAAMRTAMQSLARPRAAEAIAGLVLGAAS